MRKIRAYQVSDLADFLLARIAEDEKAARKAQDHNLPFWVAQEMGRSGGHIGPDFVNRFSPARVLAECEAKRRLVEEFTTNSLSRFPRQEDLSPWAMRMLGLLAVPYADHPDYDEEWQR